MAPTPPDGTELPADVLIGVQSRALANARCEPATPGWPRLRCTCRRGKSPAAFADHLTFPPSVARRIGRGTVEACALCCHGLDHRQRVSDGDQVLPAAETEHWALAAWRLCLAGLCYGVGRLCGAGSQMAADCRYTRVPRADVDAVCLAERGGDQSCV